MTVEKQNKVIKMLITFICYLAYFRLTSMICNVVGLKNDIIISFIADFIFLFGIVFAYKNNLKSDFKKLKTNYKISRIIKVILIGAVIIFAFNALMGALTDAIFPAIGAIQDTNTKSLFSESSNSIIFVLFKTMIFAVIAEELLFRETLSDVIDNKFLFIIVSSVVYATLNIIFDVSKYVFVDFITYFLPALIFSTIYVKNDRNIIILMLIKFTYQIIPLTILLLGLGK